MPGVEPLSAFVGTLMTDICVWPVQSTGVAAAGKAGLVIAEVRKFVSHPLNFSISTPFQRVLTFGLRQLGVMV